MSRPVVPPGNTPGRREAGSQNLTLIHRFCWFDVVLTEVVTKMLRRAHKMGRASGGIRKF
jgi:hypothetical protein